jgi:ABC-type multidrug transport system ATPase subunit
MVSEAVKQRKAAKKQAAASRGGAKAAGRASPSPSASASASANVSDEETDGAATGSDPAAETETADDGTDALSTAASTVSLGSGTGSKRGTPASNSSSVNGGGSSAVSAEQLRAMKAAARSCTGVLASHPRGLDVHIVNFSLTFYGTELFKDTTLELNHGRRYGLIGFNGCGKSTLLECLAAREVPIPSHIDIFLLTAEMEASDKTALECVMEVDTEVARLEAEAESLMHADPSDEVNDRLTALYERLDELDASLAEARAARILHGLGFTKAMQQKKIRDFSGGWRMRVALARALFIKPALLLLDEPTNHLDLEACVWLEAELARYNNILVLISHSQDFLNGVCTNILHVHQGTLRTYAGNYDAYVRTRMELEENQQKRYEWEQAQVAHMKDYIARFGHGSAKLARQAKSKEKLLNKVLASGLTERVSKERVLTFRFPECGTLPPPVLMVQNISFRYGPDQDWIYRDVDFGIDLDSRVGMSPSTSARESDWAGTPLPGAQETGHVPATCVRETWPSTHAREAESGKWGTLCEVRSDGPEDASFFFLFLHDGPQCAAVGALTS